MLIPFIAGGIIGMILGWYFGGIIDNMVLGLGFP